MPFDRLVDILKFARLKYPILTQRIEEAEALSRWEVAVGPAIAKQTHALRVVDQVLWVLSAGSSNKHNGFAGSRQSQHGGQSMVS